MKNTLLISLLILLGVAGLPATPHAQTRHYVRPQALGQNNGTTWSDAFTDLQTALDVAAPGDEVWVAEGVYLPTSGVGRDKRFSLASNVKLYGGFAGSETNLSQRNHEAHPTVLSGNIGSPTDSTDNVYTILYLNNPDAETRIDGLVFEGGYAHSDTTFVSISPTLSGGAVYVQAKNGVGLPLFAHCTFRNNSAKVNGGAVFVFGQGSTQSMPLFHFCNFENNAAGGAGGAVYHWGGSTVDRGIEFWGCTFDGNKAVAGQNSQGGCVYYRKNIGLNERLEVVSCNVMNNLASYGSCFLVVQLGIDKSDLVFDSCHFYGNKVGSGSVVYYEATFNIYKKTNFRIENSSFVNNLVLGGISLPSSLFGMELSPYSTTKDSVIIVGNTFLNNNASTIQFGSDSAYINIENNLFESNIDFYLALFGQYASLKNNRIIECNSLTGKLISIGGKSYVIGNKVINNQILSTGMFRWIDLINFNDTINIVNNIFGQNYFGNIDDNYNFSGNIICENNIIYSNIIEPNDDVILPFADISIFSHNLTDVPCEDFFDPAVCGTGNIVTPDPGFRDAANGDFRLLPCSPAVNAGDNAIVTALGITTDLDGAQRIKDGQVDMGAYESPTLSENAEAEVRATCINQNNGAVDFTLPNGCPPFDFAWSSPPASGADTTGLTPGLYTFTVTDQKGKVMVQTLVVQEASPLTTLSDVTPSTCSTCADGSIVVTSVSGDAPFIFQWSNGADGQIASGLLPGVYFLTLSDAWGCDTVLAFEVPFTIATSEQLDDQPAPSVWPNPCTDVLYLDWQGASRWSLVASDGKVVRSLNLASTNRQSIDLSLLPAGIYISVFEWESGRVDQNSVVVIR